jgi:hypothetical protein
VATFIVDVFCYFYKVKNHKSANDSATTEAREQISADLETSEFKEYFDEGLSKLKKYLLHQICHRLQATNSCLLGETSALFTAPGLCFEPNSIMTIL